MKQTPLFGWALVATMLGTGFSACTNEAEEVLTQESEIKLTSEITPSRVTSLDYQSTQIVEGQQIGVTIIGAKSEHNNVAWSVGEDGALSNTGDEIYYGNGTATITAYHPFNDDWDENTSYAFSVNTDQSTNAEYLASDLLWATASSEKTETAIPLTFSHKLAKINVTLVPENEDDDLNGATISIYNTKTSTTFNPTTGVISDATGEPQEIIAGVTTDDAYTASAIVIPQEVSGKFIKITHEGKTYYYKLSSGKTLASGTSYSFTLSVKGKQLINTGSSINPWNPDSEEGEEGDAEEENEDIANNQIWYTTTDGKAITLWENDMFGVNLVSNVYENGKGVMTFDGDITSIIEWAFIDDVSLTSITIPNSVTKIEEKAFYRCTSLTDVVMSNNITEIALEAFCECSSLTNITIPNSVTLINSFAFFGCSSLKEITIPSKVTTIGNEAFSGCTSMTKVNVQPIEPPYIENDAFLNCRTDLQIFVPAESFDDYKSASSWKNWNINAETDNTIEETIPNNEIWYTSTDGKVVTPYVKNTFGIAITSNTYKNGKGVIKFDGDVVSLGQSMFCGCTTLKEITIPSSVRTIFPQAFEICSSLTNITIPNSVTSIGILAFEGCSSLTNITIPNSVTQIDDETFAGCYSLESIVVENGNTVYDSRDNCNAIIKTESNKLITGCRTTVIPDDVEIIGDGSFKDCTFLTNITIPNSVTSIGNLAFYNCVSLSTVDIEATEAPTLGNNAFYAVATSLKINVPTNSVSAYKEAAGWSTYANNIYAKQ